MSREGSGRAPAAAVLSIVRVSTPLVRRKSSQVVLEAPPEPPKSGRPSKIAQMLALGHEIVRLVDEGVLEDLADAAEVLGFSRGRISQIVDLTLLAPDLQEAVLFGGAERAERKLRAVVAVGEWAAQREKFRQSTATGGVRL